MAEWIFAPHSTPYTRFPPPHPLQLKLAGKDWQRGTTVKFNRGKVGPTLIVVPFLNQKLVSRVPVVREVPATEELTIIQVTMRTSAAGVALAKEVGRRR